MDLNLLERSWTASLMQARVSDRDRSAPKRSTSEMASISCSAPSKQSPATASTGRSSWAASPATPPTVLPSNDSASRNPSPVITRSACSSRS